MSRYGGGGPSWRDRDRDRPPREMSFHDDRGRGPPEMDDRRFDERRGGGRRMDDRSWEDRRRFKPVKKIDREKVFFFLETFPFLFFALFLSFYLFLFFFFFTKDFVFCFLFFFSHFKMDISGKKVCPFLLRVFPMVSSHHKEEEYISHSRVPL